MAGFFCPRCCWYTTTLTFFYCFFHYGGNFVTQKRLDHCNGIPANFSVSKSWCQWKRTARTQYYVVVTRNKGQAPLAKPLAIKLGKAREKKILYEYTRKWSPASDGRTAKWWSEAQASWEISSFCSGKDLRGGRARRRFQRQSQFTVHSIESVFPAVICFFNAFGSSRSCHGFPLDLFLPHTF